MKDFMANKVQAKVRKPKFKVGDRVKVISDIWDNEGDIVTINLIASHGYLAGKAAYFYYEDELEPVYTIEGFEV